MQTGPKVTHFSLQQAVQLSRWLTNFLTKLTNENWFKDQGIFRLSGTQTNSQEIIDNLLQKKSFNTSLYQRDDYISALKYVLNHCALLSAEDAQVKQLKAELDFDKINTPLQFAQATNALEIFINKLIKSNDYQKLCVAELLYNYLTLLSIAQRHSTTNKMSSHNLSIILAPFISKLLGIEPRMDTKLQQICEPLIASNNYFGSYFHQHSSDVTDTYVTQLRRDYEHARSVYENLLAKKQVVEASIEKINLVALNHELEKVKNKIGELETEINYILIQSYLPLMTFPPLPEEVEERQLKLVTILNQVSDDDEIYSEANLVTPESSSPLSATSAANSREPTPERRSSLLFQAPIAITQINFETALQRAQSSAQGDKVIRKLIEFLKADYPIQNIAKLLFDHKAELMPYQIELGDVLSKPEDEFQQLLTAYVENFDVKGKNFAIAFREFLESGFRLPGESQKIDRIVKAFAEHYYKHNQQSFPTMASDQFKGSDKVYGLAFATVMLNTDLHNPALRNKMTKKEFIRNLQDYNLNKDMLNDIFQEIKRHEIQLPIAKTSAQQATRLS